MENYKALAAAGIVAFAASAPSAAEQFYGFADVSINYHDWTDKTEDRASFGGKEDFFFLEVEGGAGYDWGDIYGFIDLENPTNIGDDREGESDNFRTFAKGTIAVNIADTNWNWYGMAIHFEDGGFYESNLVFGASYDYFTDHGFWIKPFLGAHILSETFAGNGYNGLFGGWVLGYDFEVAGQKFSVTNWHETEFLRKDQFRNGADGRRLDSYGQNGAVSFWWHLPDSNLTAGLQYRYFDQKLGDANYGDALIYTLKYNF